MLLSQTPWFGWLGQLSGFTLRLGQPQVLVALACLYATYKVVYALYLSPLRNVPGPLLARLTNKRAELLTAMGNQVHKALEEYEKYGDVFMYQPRSISIANPEDIRTVLGNPEFVKADYYKVVDLMGLENTASARDHKVASMRRRQIGPYFSNSYLSKMEETILKHGILAIKEKWDGVLEQSGKGHAEVNYHRTFHYATFDTIGSLAFGRDFGSLKNDDPTVSNWRTCTLVYFALHSCLPILKLYPFSLLVSSYERVYRDFESHGANCIAERRRLLAELEKNGQLDERKPADLLQAFLDCCDPESKTRMSPTEVHAETMIALVGGSVTSSDTLMWTIHLLMLYPECYKRAVDEVRSAFSKDHVVTFREAKAKLPYLEACIYESLRKCPATGGQFPRVVPKNGAVLGGHFIPGGTEVNVNIIAANHNTKYWKDPHRFDPTRFLSNDEAKRGIFTFSYGVRVCPGKQLAWIEIFTILANILKDYDIRLPPGYTERGPDILDANGYPKLMATKHFVSSSPVNVDRDCCLAISKAQ